MMDRILKAIFNIPSTIQQLWWARRYYRRLLQRWWYKFRAAVWLAVWGERLWFDYPPERWWYRNRYILRTIRLRATQLCLVAVAACSLIALVASGLMLTPATAWVNFEEGDTGLTLNVIYKNGTLPGDPTHTPAAICCTVRSEGGGIPLEVFTCKDVRGYPFPLGYFRIPIETRERIITVSVKLVYDVRAGGRVVEIVPSTRLMGVSAEGWEILH